MLDRVLDAALARRVKLVGFDVDGVLTDNGVYSPGAPTPPSCAPASSR